MACPDLQLPGEEVSSVMVRGWVWKRSGFKLLASWHKRYGYIRRNFLFLFNTVTDSTPKKVWCLDGCIIDKQAPTGNKWPIFITTEQDNRVLIALDSAELQDQWAAVIDQAASFTIPYNWQQDPDYLSLVASQKAALAEVVQLTHRLQLAGREKEVASKQDSVRITELTAELDAAKATIQTLTAERDDALRAVESLRAAAPAEQLKLANTIQTLQRSLEEAQESAAAAATLAQARISDLEESYSRSVDIQVGLQTQLNSSVSQLQSAIAARQGADDKVVVLSAQLEEAHAKVGSLTAAVAQLRRHSTALPPIPDAAGGPAASPSPPLLSPWSSVGGGSPLADEADWTPIAERAQTLERSGALSEAERCWVTVVELIKSRVDSPCHEAVAAVRNVGRLLCKQNRFDEAEEWFHQALVGMRTLYGEESAGVAALYTDLASALREQEKYVEAEKHAVSAVASLKRAEGDQEVALATALYNLAGLSKAQGKYQSALNTYQLALEIYRRRLGDSQQEVGDTLYQLGCLYTRQQEVGPAMHYLQAAADAYSKVFGATDSRVSRAMDRARRLAAVSSSPTRA